MEKSIWRKVAFSFVALSILMMGVFAIAWYREQHRTYTLTIATGEKGGSYYNFGQSLAKVVAKYHPNIKIQVLETYGSRQNEEWLKDNKVQLAIMQSDTPVSPSTQVISFLFPEVFHLVANKQSGIEEVGDLQGKRIALMPEGSGSYVMFWNLSNHYELKKADFETINVSFDQASEALRQGKVDALFTVFALKNPKMNQLMINRNLRLIPITQAAALKLIIPAVEESKIPQGTYNGAVPIPEKDLASVAVRSVLVTHKEIDESIIYNITQVIYEARNELVKEFAQASMIAPPDTQNNLGFFYHQGAQSYYNKGQPSFIVEYAEPIGLLISISVLLVSGVWQLRMWLQNNQKNRADFYNLEIINLIDKIHTVNDIEQLEIIRRQLFEMFNQVVIDLDQDRISPESFNSFSFPWEIALTTIRHRETVLLNSKNSVNY